MKLTIQEFEDLHSAIYIALANLPPNSPNFHKALKKLDKKFKNKKFRKEVLLSIKGICMECGGEPLSGHKSKCNATKLYCKKILK